MKEITFITFNCGIAGKVVNGPGICLVNFVKRLMKAGIKVNVFSELKSNEGYVKSLSDPNLEAAIRRSDVLHHWSGLGPKFIKIINLAKKINKEIKVVVGPNVLDLVKASEERSFLNQIKFDKIFTVNTRLKYLLMKEYSLSQDQIDLLMIGPDEKLWAPVAERNNKILWKGNSKQFVKDIGFGLEVAKKMPQYEFEFIGYPDLYNYEAHILKAKKCKLYMTTSLSETMGMCLLESWMSGLPSITHPKIYLHGENYKTGIITNRDVDSYCEAIKEIMENEELYRHLSNGAQHYVKKHFSNTIHDYFKSLGLEW